MTTYTDILARAEEATQRKRLEAAPPKLIRRQVPNGKLCSTCQQFKEPSDFSPNKRYRDGLQSECKSCHAMRARRAFLR